MSAIIFQSCEDRGFVATDTLACDQHGQPGLFRSKAFYVPHLKTIVFATGFAEIMEDWFVCINRRMRVDGVEHLNNFAPEELRRIWAKFQEEMGAHLDGYHCQSTTVYLMGISEITGKIVVYAYRSSTGFASEKLPPGIGVKPECTVPEGQVDIFEMMKQQRHIQENSGLPLSQQIHIGGEVQIYQLTAQGCEISTYARFDDYEQAREKMVQKINMSRYLEEWENSISKKSD
ncbi:hypothetical protein ACT3R7_19985 [Halomonas sp. AOP43-A1-21]